MTDIVVRLRLWGDSYHLHKESADEIEKLRAALRVAMDAVEYWASYASLYAHEKHDLAGDLQKLRAALGEKE
jgi:hypothetical protein